MAVQIDHLKIRADTRGFVFEPLDPEIIQLQKNVHIVISGPGVVRGNHYHLHGTETVAVTGRALVRIRGNREMQNIQVPANKVYRFIIPPRVSHAFKNIDDQPIILVCFNTHKHDIRNQAVIEDILIPSGA